jgi:hypothetical protein
MRTAELETVVRNKLGSVGLSAALNEEKSQFLDVSGGFFAEVVLDDASRLPAAEQIVRSVQEELKAKGVEIDVIVRAVWKVKTINFIGPARSVSGGLKAALEFEAVLESGSRTCTVNVEVTLAALNKLREKLALSDKVGFPGWAKDGDVDEETLGKVVKEFLDFQLSSGGTSYWDPILFPKLELKEAIVSYLMPDSKGFKQLRAAIDSYLGDHAKESSLRDLASRDVRIRDFERILPDLSSHLGGAFGPGEKLPTNALSLYQGLGPVERERLKQHYLQKVGLIPENLRQKYTRIFLD